MLGLRGVYRSHLSLYPRTSGDSTYTEGFFHTVVQHIGGPEWTRTTTVLLAMREIYSFRSSPALSRPILYSNNQRLHTKIPFTIFLVISPIMICT